jgi:DNA-binding transcriptional regulator YhcF (GntR family)
MALHLELQHASPIPLYHQIAETIRYRIATGALTPGTVLPPLREAAAQWGANLHTVRRAYVELAREGLVATQVPHGTVVLPGTSPAAGTGESHALEAFADRVVREARRRHGLGVDGLLDLLGKRRETTTRSAAGSIVHVVECSATQSADLAAQLARRWRIHAIPWPLGRPAPPGPGPVVATYFHYAEIRAAWPKRMRDVHFLGIRPDPALKTRLQRQAARTSKLVPVLVYEREESMLHNITSDLRRVLPSDRFRIVPRLVTRPDALSRELGRGLVLLSPRVWGETPEPLRSDPRVFEARYIFESRDLELLGSTLKWRPQ